MEEHWQIHHLNCVYSLLNCLPFNRYRFQILFPLVLRPIDFIIVNEGGLLSTSSTRGSILKTMRCKKDLCFREFCQNTSLHGWKFFDIENFDVFATIFWAIIIIGMGAIAGLTISTHVTEFNESTVSYNIDSPTVSLDEVYTPSVAICNLNTLRRSFLQHLIEDKDINTSMSFGTLASLVDKIFVTGGQELQEDSFESQMVAKIVDSSAYNQLYADFLDLESYKETLKSLASSSVEHFHSLRYVNETDRNTFEARKKYLPEIASQFRPRDMFLKIRFPGYGIGLDGGFPTDISETCFWITPFAKEPLDVEDYTTIQPLARTGTSNGLQLMLDAEVYDYASSVSGSEGFVISIIHHLDIPIMKHSGLNIHPGQSSYVSVTPALMNTTSEVRSRFSPEKRQCYFEGEIDLPHLPSSDFRYDMSNCLFEATLQMIEKKCECVSRYFQVDDKVKVCVGEGKKCMANLNERMGDFRNVTDKTTGKARPCFANCQDQKFAVQMTQAGYPNYQSFRLTSDFCLILDKIKESCQNEKKKILEQKYPNACKYAKELDGCQDQSRFDDKKYFNLTALVTQYAKDNVAKINIFLKDPFVQRTMREEKIPLVTFIGSVGGLLGLWLGFSVISMIEVIYMCFMKIRSVFRCIWDRPLKALRSSSTQPVNKR